MASQPKANCHDKSNLLPEASRHSETRVVAERVILEKMSLASKVLSFRKDSFSKM